MSYDESIYTEAMQAADKVRECLRQLDFALQVAARHTAIRELVVTKWNCDKQELEQIHYDDDGKPFNLRANLEL